MDVVPAALLVATTRSARRRPGLGRPVDPQLVEECLEIADQASTGGDIARCHFVSLTDPARRVVVGDYYRRVFFEEYLPRWGTDDASLWRAVVTPRRSVLLYPDERVDL
jgi:hypothetical protein